MSFETTPSVQTTPTHLCVRVRVEQVERVSPSFARITFAGEGLHRIGTPGSTLDQRIKLIFPGASGTLPDLSEAGDDWYTRWLEFPAQQRGVMRTYSIRELLVDEAGTRVVIDFVLHLEAGLTGPAALWASGARPGDEILLLGPVRGYLGPGIEYAPGLAREVLLAGDETAAPAIARILEDVGPQVRGVAFIEVPAAADALSIAAPEGVRVEWLARDGAAHGARLSEAVVAYLGAPAQVAIERDGGEDLVWETARFSGEGEAVPEDPTNHAERYFWFAGESSVVTSLRRHLVRNLGVDRKQVAFMGYWKHGVAMRG